MKKLWLALMLVVLFSSPIHAQDNHPCGNPGLDFQRLTTFFLVKFHADYRDLNKDGVIKWVAHHSFGDRGITIVRLFQSRLQSKVAVLHGRPMPGEDGIDKFCIVKINASYILTFKMKVIDEILNFRDKEI